MPATSTHTIESRIRDVLSCATVALSVSGTAEQIFYRHDTAFKARCSTVRAALNRMVKNGEVVKVGDRYRLCDGVTP